MKKLLILAALAVGACSTVPTDEPATRMQFADSTLPPMKSFRASRPSNAAVANGNIAQDFLDLHFELESGRTLPVFTRFETPITVRLTGQANSQISSDLAALLGRLRSEAGIDIRRIPHGGGEASITIETMPRARMQRAVPQAACFVVPRVTSWDEFRVARSSTRTLDWTTLTTREHAAVFIPNDVSPQEVRDCLHEEVGQALGPLNDLYRLPDSVFNDDNFNAVLTGFDMLILRAYYDPALRSGMSREEVAQRLPAILSRLNPGGNRGAAVPPRVTDRDWVQAIEDALGGRLPVPSRIAAAQRAVVIAQSRGWQDIRLGFSYFALGRLSLSRDAETAVTAFVTAGRHFDRVAPGSIQSAHVDMQLAAFALSAGDAEQVLTLVGRALPAATRAENASLMATLLMIRAEALELQGRMSEAAAVRLDSLGWARYGFGRDAAVRDRLTEVAALSPNNRS